jgi:hypothetical protein
LHLSTFVEILFILIKVKSIKIIPDINREGRKKNRLRRNKPKENSNIKKIIEFKNKNSLDKYNEIVELKKLLISELSSLK